MKKLRFFSFVVSTMVMLSIFWFSCKKDNLQELILEGNNNNNNNSECDTNFTVSYQNDIVPILRFNKHPGLAEECYACHTAATSARGDGILLDTYSNLRVYVLSGELLCAVKRLGCPNVENMPYLGVPLEACDIARIEKWINQGSPDN